MITINTKNKEVNIPDKWEDLTTTQFISLSALLRRFIQNEIDLFDFRINLLGILSGYKRSKKRKFRKHRSLINERIFIIADMLVFPIKPYYPKPEQLEVFSEKFKIELQTRFLFEIFDVNYLDEKETAENFLEYEPSINYNIKKNLLPSFTHNETLYTGPFFNIDENGVLETDLTALEYIDASEYVSLFRDTGDKRYIAAVAAVLYRDDRSFYKSSDAQKNIDSFTNINPDVLSAILLIFNNIIFDHINYMKDLVIIAFLGVNKTDLEQNMQKNAEYLDLIKGLDYGVYEKNKCLKFFNYED